METARHSRGFRFARARRPCHYPVRGDRIRGSFDGIFPAQLNSRTRLAALPKLSQQLVHLGGDAGEAVAEERFADEHGARTTTGHMLDVGAGVNAAFRN